MEYKEEKDGVEYINVYSKGQTNLGRQLSNFAFTPFHIPFWGKFWSVEGFWYWWLTGDDKLRQMYGFQAKKYGKSILKVKEEVPKRALKIAYKAKLRYNPILRQRFYECDLPFVHYYVYGGKIICPKEFEWTGDLWNEIRNEYFTNNTPKK